MVDGKVVGGEIKPDEGVTSSEGRRYASDMGCMQTLNIRERGMVEDEGERVGGDGGCGCRLWSKR